MTLGFTFLIMASLGSNGAQADEPISQRQSFGGTVDFFATGASMAADTDSNNKVDTLAQPATVQIAMTDLPSGAMLISAYLYWSGTIQDWGNCGSESNPPPSNIDDEVDFTPPGAGSPTSIVADDCYCSGGDSTSYDIQACRADVTDVILTQGVSLWGQYTVDGFNARANDGATDNASFSSILV